MESKGDKKRRVAYLTWLCEWIANQRKKKRKINGPNLLKTGIYELIERQCRDRICHIEELLSAN